ncbi:Type 1 glutamine amidotransferase-like domain-containing protein [Smaragdicoccus niigatensis]|uniref:Type 1 glutamine amidotransferase-like domain-containing protein n=1 Tax=Smaragdicoccus niigatensis TaxID=359359 RepID=UPI00037DA94E|nr:Type 1 glutamine amidotransferase-like domain-containing protein [Smaragdicoccus niigatensis]
MRLFLSSYRFGAHQDRFLELVGGGRRALVVANACDSWPASARASAVTSDVVPLQKLGFQVEELDLRQFVGATNALRKRLETTDVLWVRGGNTFVLRAQFGRCGADVVVPELLRTDSFVYAGYSAGACLMTPTLHGLEIEDPVDEVLPTCGIDPIWTGLGLVDHAIVPHWDSPELGQTGSKVVSELQRLGVPHQTLRDDQAIIVDDGSAEVF